VYYNLIVLEVPSLYNRNRMRVYDDEPKVRRGIFVPSKTY
jgi:hypothetical protein